MAYHYSDMGMPTEMNEPYIPEYKPYIIQNSEAEYEVRSTVLDDRGEGSVSAVTFDKFEELIWVGNTRGHVTSYYGPQMRRYTAFRVHMTEEIRDIVTLDRGLFILSKTQLRHQIRRGLVKYTHTSENMKDMQCLLQASATNILMGGHQDTIIDFDVANMTETIIPITEDGCAVLRSGGSSILACGSANGTVTLRDIRTPDIAEHVFKAHSACLSDLNMQGNIIITSGFAQTNTMAVAEQYVRVWDVRHLKTANGGAWSLPVASPPLLLNFLPTVSGRALAAASDGHVTLLNVHDKSEASNQSVFHVDTQGSLCTVMDVSTTSQAFVFGDQSGHVHLFSSKHNNEPIFNNFSRETTFATPVRLPYVGFSENFSFSSVPLPPLMFGRWFHQLPDEFLKKVSRKPRPIDPEILKTMKMKGPIGYAPNPGTRRRNEYPYIDDTLEDLAGSKEIKVPAEPVNPIHTKYQKYEVRYSNDPNETLENINKTGRPGIEATQTNSYCNPMLQILYNMPPLKSVLVEHTCVREFCLTCELGFLFRMLDRSGGAPCQATNFLRAFRTVPEAAALGLILSDRGTDKQYDLVTLIQNWSRFILQQLHYEFLMNQTVSTCKFSDVPVRSKHRLKKPINGRIEDIKFSKIELNGPSESNHNVKIGFDDIWKFNGIDKAMLNHTENHQNIDKELSKNEHFVKEESEISKLFAIARQQLNRCLKCNKEEERESVALACALQHVSTDSERSSGFLEVMRASLCARRSTPAWCERCAKFTPTTQRGRLLRLPPILTINCGAVTSEVKSYWAKRDSQETHETTKHTGNVKPCRYGSQCIRLACRFIHPDSPSEPENRVTTGPQDVECVIPRQLYIRLQPDGDIAISDKVEQTDKHKKQSQCETEYTLTAAVVCIEDYPRNLVAYVRVMEQEEVKWYLFNDLGIEPVSEEEVSECSPWWKSPCVLFYSNPEALHCKDVAGIS